MDITIPPTDQFLNSYTIATEPTGADPAIHQNYLNIVAPTSEVSERSIWTVRDLPSSDFHRHSGSSYSGASVKVAFGSHTVSAPSAFGLTVYGFGTTTPMATRRLRCRPRRRSEKGDPGADEVDPDRRYLGM